MKKWVILGLLALLVLGLLAGAVYAALYTDYGLWAAAKVIEQQSPPWDVLDIRRVKDGRVWVVVSAPNLMAITEDEFIGLWDITSKAMRLLNPQAKTLMIVFGYPEGDQYALPTMFECPIDKTDFTTDEGCRRIPLYAMMPAKALKWVGR